MDSQQAATLAMGIVVDVAILWIALHARSIIRNNRQACGYCKHSRSRHVSAFDWDSNYGDPQQVGPNYRKPGTCRECGCHSFREEAA